MPEMLKFGWVISLLLISYVGTAAAQGSGNRTSLWQTLSGNAPKVIARGGFSGLFPDSSNSAYAFAIPTSLPNVVLWCDVQLTSDGVGVCLPDLRLNNASNIMNIFPNGSRTHIINGVPFEGWFVVDFSLDDLVNVSLTQGVFSRTEEFDNSVLQILTVEEVARQFRPPGYWLNVQHDAFFSQQNLSMRSYVISVSRSVVVNYISSPEVSFLRSIMTRFIPSQTKLIFRFLGVDEVELSTNQTYGSLLRNLTFVRTFASGILVPKSYIWPVDSLYLQPHTSIVMDAHREGLEVYASDFANDVPFAYNFSYDPIAEYLSFIDNGEFSVDGLLSDFPITPSEAIDCFSHLGRNASRQVELLVISEEGASGDYPGCTDLAYTQAISDGVDVIDCPVQMSQDGVPFCLGSINLIDRTTVLNSPFSNLAMNVPELNIVAGILAFNLTWNQTRSLTPQILNPHSESSLFRNPLHSNDGKLISLSEFLALANNATSVSGVLISIENAAYLAENRGLDVADAVLDALSEAGYSNQTRKTVMIQSTNSSVLMHFKERRSAYQRVYWVDENIRDALNSTIEDITNFADSVVINKDSVYPRNNGFLTGTTDVVPKLQAFGLRVYVKLFSNEFMTQAWDYFSDATVEINSFLSGAGINGVVTDFPRTASDYRRNRCLGRGNAIPSYMTPVEPGGLLQLIQPQPPAQAPNPVLTDADVAEPPLPETAIIPPSTSTDNNVSSTAPPPTQPSAQPKLAVKILLSNLAILLATLLLL